MEMLRTTLFAGLAALAVTGCGSGNSASSSQSRSAGNSASSPQSRSAPNASAPHHGYPQPFETAFMRSCKIRGTPSRCECALQYIEANVSYPDLVNATPAIKAGRPPQWYIAAVTTCRNR